MKHPYLRCPKCGKSDLLSIDATVNLKITQVDEVGFNTDSHPYAHQADFSDNSTVYCGCGHSGELDCFYGPSGAYPGDSPEQRAHRAIAAIHSYMDDGETKGGDEELPYYTTLLLEDLFYHFGMQQMCEFVDEAGKAYNTAVAAASVEYLTPVPLTDEEFAKSSMRCCPFCRSEDVGETYPTDENAPVGLHCNKCEKQWDIIWQHIGYEENPPHE